MLIDKYNNGELHPVTMVYQLAHNLQLNLEMKETVTPGKATIYV